MSRLISVAYTAEQVIARTKTVTRRLGWWEDRRGRRIVHPGDQLTCCRKVMGRKPGEPLVRLAQVEVVDVRRERLSLMIEHRAYGLAECDREGFPELNPETFIDRYFVQAQGIPADAEVTRIQWRYLEDQP